MARARIAVWELADPSSVTKARILVLSICTVSLGARSLASRITGSSQASSASGRPRRILTTRSATSRMSAARALRYSFSACSIFLAK